MVQPKTNKTKQNGTKTVSCHTHTEWEATHSTFWALNVKIWLSKFTMMRSLSWEHECGLDERENQRKISTISTLKLSTGRVLKVTNRPPDLQLTKDLHFRHVAEWGCSRHSFSNWMVASNWRNSLWEKMGRTGAEKCSSVSLLSQ